MKTINKINRLLIPMFQQGGAWVNNLYMNPDISSRRDVTNLISKPIDQGYQQGLDNAKLSLQFLQGLRQDKQLKFRKEQADILNEYRQDSLDFRKHDAEIKNALAEDRLKLAKQSQELNSTIKQIELQKNFTDELGLDILPDDAETWEGIKNEYGVKIPSDLNGYQEQYTNLQKALSDPRTKKLLEKSTLQKNLTKQLDNAYSNLNKIMSDPKKAIYYDSDELYSRMKSVTDNINKFGESEDYKTAYYNNLNKLNDLSKAYSDEGFALIKADKDKTLADAQLKSAKAKESMAKADLSNMKMDILKSALDDASTNEEKIKILNGWLKGKSGKTSNPNEYAIAQQLYNSGAYPTYTEALAAVARAKKGIDPNELSKDDYLNVGNARLTKRFEKQFNDTQTDANGLQIKLDKRGLFIQNAKKNKGAVEDFLEDNNIYDTYDFASNEMYNMIDEGKAKLLRDGTLFIPPNGMTVKKYEKEYGVVELGNNLFDPKQDIGKPTGNSYGLIKKYDNGYSIEGVNVKDPLIPVLFALESDRNKGFSTNLDPTELTPEGTVGGFGVVWRTHKDSINKMFPRIKTKQDFLNNKEAQIAYTKELIKGYDKKYDKLKNSPLLNDFKVSDNAKRLIVESLIHYGGGEATKNYLGDGTKKFRIKVYKDGKYTYKDKTTEVKKRLEHLMSVIRSLGIN